MKQNQISVPYNKPGKNPERTTIQEAQTEQIIGSDTPHCEARIRVLSRALVTLGYGNTSFLYRTLTPEESQETAEELQALIDYYLIKYRQASTTGTGKLTVSQKEAITAIGYAVIEYRRQAETPQDPILLI